jgi:hypothetical protein
VSVAIVTYLVLFSVVVWVALARFDYDEPFGNGDALAIGLAGAIALGASCLLGATLSRRRAQLRDVTPSLVRWAALVTGLILAGAVLLLGFAPALRAITAPIYLVAAIGGTWLGATLGTERR